MLKSLKDLKIMSAIIEDARIPVSSLAKKCRLKRENVQYRIKNLEKNLIAGYQARINLNLIADSIYTTYLNISGLKREEIILKLKKLPQVHWIASTLGRWNYILTFSVNNENKLSKFIDLLFGFFNKSQLEYSITQQIEEYKDSFSGLFGNNLLIISQKQIENKEIDEVDKRILGHLTKNARVSNLEIADKIEMTREAIRMRIKNLEKKEIILNYRTLIKPQALELENFVLAVKCNSGSSKKLSEICSFLSNNKFFSYVCTTAGEFNILSVVHLKSLKELDDICTKLRLNFPDIISEIEPLPLIEVASQNYLP